MFPLLVDGTGQYIGKWESTNSRRFFTGIFAGISTICLFSVAAILGFKHGKYIHTLISNL